MITEQSYEKITTATAEEIVNLSGKGRFFTYAYRPYHDSEPILFDSGAMSEIYFDICPINDKSFFVQNSLENNVSKLLYPADLIACMDRKYPFNKVDIVRGKNGEEEFRFYTATDSETPVLCGYYKLDLEQ
ncbi:MAG TPA: hypothetical protein VHA74_02295 [Candidatus Dojkabacteria bacterium]|nr:hypothetical protein [Candidatus Dojkabacteria bacterium]